MSDEQKKPDEPQSSCTPLKVDDLPADKQSVFRRPRPSATHTYVEMEVSKETYAEVKYLLEQAGWDHCIMDDGALDLSGIALKKAALPDVMPITVNGVSKNITVPIDGKLSYEDLVKIEYGDDEKRVLSMTWRSAKDKYGGILAPGQSVELDEGMVFNMAHTG